MKQSTKVGIGLVLTGLLLAGAGCYSKTNTTTTNTSSTGNTVSIKGMAFSPASLTVKQGTTVSWTNSDSVPHTVTGDNGGPASGQLSGGQKYTYTFDTVGSYPYHCSNHTNMTGTVTVTQ